ncbi:MAG: hypothetical protein M3Y54_17695 [Bacteroidota bacterium]|nr:hypothetical protein [Bacteroidota bacterium]
MTRIAAAHDIRQGPAFLQPSPLPADVLVLQQHGNAFVSGHHAGGEISGAAL